MSCSSEDADPWTVILTTFEGLFVCLFLINYVGMFLQPVIVSLPGGPQTDREKKTAKKNKKQSTNMHKSLQKNNNTIQNSIVSKVH